MTNKKRETEKGERKKGRKKERKREREKNNTVKMVHAQREQ